MRETVLECGNPRDDTAAFRRCLGQFGTGITVMTARADDGFVGMTANSFSSLSLDPPLILWSIKRSNASFAAFEAASHFAVNVLAKDQMLLSKHFGKPGKAKFDAVAWAPGLGGSPLLEGCLASFECLRVGDHPGGDHLIIVGEVERFTRYDRDALLFVQGRYSVAEDQPDLRPLAELSTQSASAGPMDSFMTAMLYRAHGTLSAAVEAGRQAEGLTLLQSRIMAAVQTLPGRTVDELLPNLFLGRNAAEETVVELKAMGLVTCDAAGRLTMTGMGHERNQHLLTRASAIESQALADLPEADIAACRRALRAIVRRGVP